MKRRIPKRNFISAANKGNIDSKLTQAALLLEFSFDYKVDFKNRVIKLSGEVNQEMFDMVESAMSELESQSREGVTVRINSPGGETYQALAIIGRFKRSKCMITTEGYGHIMSAATLILAAGDKRKMSEYSFFMHHESSYEVEGRHSDIKREVQQAEREEQHWAQWMEKFTKKPKAFWLEQGTGKNAYFTPGQLLKLGVIDEIF